MDSTRVTLAALWVSVMLTYLLGDVLRIFAGDFTPGQMDGQPVGQTQWLVAACIMLIPIVMIVLSLVLPFSVAKWACIVLAVGLVIFNLFGLPYKGMYDNLLIVVSFGFCAAITWYAWTWTT
ncbi:MAG: hypothetical protein HGB10_10540 [Coriobacteriia bacterium]|nr:hypothetical protein [Coriobacteriia bacterium]